MFCNFTRVQLEGPTFEANHVEEAETLDVKIIAHEQNLRTTFGSLRPFLGNKEITIATGVPIYFCDPHSPWQRGSNENTNGLLRQYMPKGTDLFLHTAKDLLKFERSLDDRPRMTLVYMKPKEKLAELVALFT